MSRRGFAFCAKPARRRAFATRMLPRSSTLPRQNRSELLLRDGVCVCRRGNAREPHQTLWPARGRVGAGNRDAGRRGIGCGPQAEAGSSGHQTKQYHGDLGLAKPAPDAPTEAAISTPGAFAGTPEFASPEQFVGVGVDIRSNRMAMALGVSSVELYVPLCKTAGAP
jgi:hypothetical protein